MVQGVDAVLLTGCRSDTLSLMPDYVIEGAGLRMPLVMLDGPPHPRLDARVVLDLEPALTEALQYLEASGRTRIAFIDSVEGPRERRELYRRYLAEAGLAGRERPDFAGEESLDGGVRATRQVLEGWPEVDAIMVYNDIMAIGALKALAEAGKKVPEDVAVIGIDGLAMGRAVTPELSTLAIDKAELARLALAALARGITGDIRGESSLDVSRVKLTLTLRDSA
jgi:LacI family transcriptional regulator